MTKSEMIEYIDKEFESFKKKLLAAIEKVEKRKK